MPTRITATVGVINRTGVYPSVVTAFSASGVTFDNTQGLTFMAIQCTSLATVTATFNVSAQIDSSPVTNRTGAIPSGSSLFYGPFPMPIYGTIPTVDFTATNVGGCVAYVFICPPS